MGCMIVSVLVFAVIAWCIAVVWLVVWGLAVVMGPHR